MSFVKLQNGNYVNIRFICSVYTVDTGSGWKIDCSGGEGGTLTLGTIDTPLFSTNAKAQQFIQQVFRGLDPNSLTDI